MSEQPDRVTIENEVVYFDGEHLFVPFWGDECGACINEEEGQLAKLNAALNAAEENQRPAGLTPDMLGEEDRLRLSFLRNAGISKRLEIRRAMQVECDDRVQDSLTEMLGYHEKSIAWADRLLGSAD